MTSAHASPRPVKESPPLPSSGAAWALFLDVDGTLLGFSDDPDMVRVAPDLLATLASLHDALDGALALISGRRLYDLDRLFGPPLVAAAGLHGLQRRRPDGSEDNLQPDPGTVDALHRHVTALATRLPHMRVEDKGTCMTLHYREMPAQESAVIAGARRIAGQLPGYEIQPGDHIIEIKPAGIDKGHAVNAFLDEPPFSGRRPVYLGDDLTDEHAFAAVNARHGISIRVGSREPTRAHFTLRHPAAVQAWLEGVLVHL